MSQISVDSVIPQSGTTITIGGSGDTVTLGSGASQSGFGSAAYAANASASTGAVNIDASDNLQFDSGYGSTATAYGCRAWVNFIGTGTVTINDSGNVSSITDLAAGYYRVNFQTNLADANYSAIAVPAPNADSTNPRRCNVFGNNATNPAYVAPTTSNFTIITAINAGLSDASRMCVAIFR